MRAATRSFPLSLGVALALLLLVIGWSFNAGRFALSPMEVLRALWSAAGLSGSGLEASAQSVVIDVRMPRVVAAVAVGAALSAAGAAYQSLFRNALVSPDILGISAGCALGAACAVLLSLPFAAVQASAFAGGIVAVAIVAWIGSRIAGRDPTLVLVLTGVVVGAMLASLLALAKQMADPYEQLPALGFWLLGSFAAAGPRDFAFALPAIALGVALLAALRWRIDVLALSDDEARSLGADVKRIRVAVVAAATLITASAVALAGNIAWVGLVVPHAARLIAGPGFARMLPLSIVLGAAFTLAVDTVCRTLFTVEVAPGVATAFIGTPVFLALLAYTARERP